MKLIKKIFKIFNNLISNRIIKWIIIPSMLLLLWFSLSLTYSSYRSFTVLQYAQNQDKNNNFIKKRLLKGQKLTGEFEAKENNLGIVSVGFVNVPKVDFEEEETLVFRIKEKGHLVWDYENKYKSGLISSGEYFPFGFKAIKNSKGKIYDFEILSLNSNIYKAIETNDTNPVYKTKYKFSKTEIFKDRRSIIEFAIKKIVTFFIDYDTLLSSSVFLLPFVFYLTWLIILKSGTNYFRAPFFEGGMPIGKTVLRRKSFTFLVLTLVFIDHLKAGKQIVKIIFGKRKQLFVFLVLILIFLDIIFFEDLITGFMLGLLGFWVIAIYANKFKSHVTFVLSFVIILLSVLSVYFNWKISIDKASVFAYMFIIIGLIQNLLEYKNISIGKQK